MSTRNAVQDSPEREEIRAEYDRLWGEMQTADANKVRRMLERDRRQHAAGSLADRTFS